MQAPWLVLLLAVAPPPNSPLVIDTPVRLPQRIAADDRATLADALENARASGTRGSSRVAHPQTHSFSIVRRVG